MHMLHTGYIALQCFLLFIKCEVQYYKKHSVPLYLHVYRYMYMWYYFCGKYTCKSNLLLSIVLIEPTSLKHAA